MNDPLLPTDRTAKTAREPIEPDRLRTDIALCLQLAGTKTSRANLAREAFQYVAEAIVAHFEARGYEVTAPDSRWSGPGPQPVFRMPPNARRED